MNIRFTNGLIYSWDRKNNPLILSDGVVSIKTFNKKPISASFAHGPRDYYAEIPSGSWNITTTERTWLTIVLDNFSSEFMYVTTTINPTNNYGPEFPDTPVIGECFFHHLHNRMFIWSGAKWINIIQVTLGYVENNKTYPENSGTQVGLNKVSSPTAILKDQAGLPIIKFMDEHYHYFLTERDNKK
jgi:hypothetical protein